MSDPVTLLAFIALVAVVVLVSVALGGYVACRTWRDRPLMPKAEGSLTESDPFRYSSQDAPQRYAPEFDTPETEADVEDLISTQNERFLRQYAAEKAHARYS